MSTDNNYLVTPVVGTKNLIGRVKWFNTKAGYGFVTITDGIQSGTDVFIHHSDINVVNQQYKYLIQGEYVEFDLVKVESEKYEWQASNVSGIKGGKLMCETRHDLKLARNEYKSNKLTENNDSNVSSYKSSKNNTLVRARGEGPRDNSKKDWNLTKDFSKKRQQTNFKPIVNGSNQGSTIITIQSK
jgi:cold shock protein